MEEHIFVTVNGLRVKIKMSYHIISYSNYHVVGLQTLLYSNVDWDIDEVF